MGKCSQVGDFGFKDELFRIQMNPEQSQLSVCLGLRYSFMQRTGAAVLGQSNVAPLPLVE